MLSLTKCKKILNKRGIFYIDEEVIIIRNTLYKLAQVIHNIQKNNSQNDTTLNGNLEKTKR
jgi:hypothetical protein